MKTLVQITLEITHTDDNAYSNIMSDLEQGLKSNTKITDVDMGVGEEMEE